MGLYGGVLQLRDCNTRSLRQRWSFLYEKGYTPQSQEDANLNLERTYNASLTCELGIVSSFANIFMSC
jgi:hypothetical protein